MSRPAVWYALVESSDTPSTTVPADALVNAGLDASPLQGDYPIGPGLVFFSDVAPPLFQFIREASRNGIERILAVCLAETALEIHDTWRLLRCGAADVLCWERSPDPTAEITARLTRWGQIDRLVASPLVQNNLIGRSLAWISVVRQVAEVACFTDAPVLIMGETGTGKELITRLIHSLDPRPNKKNLVVLDCTTIVRELSGSEFFGHERGAFTGATGPRDGAFALADRGSLFLDEIGELPLVMQSQLLRVVQERTYKRVGGNSWSTTEFRLVCATNRDLVEEVERGQFRSDLYYRIASVVCRLPPLRDRPGDIIPLFQHFFAEHNNAAESPDLDEPVREYLLRRDYPGNVRELKQLAMRIAYRHVGPGPVTVGDLPEDERPAGELAESSWRDVAFDTSIRRAIAQGVGLKEIGRLAAESAIRIALDEEQGSLQRAAQKLGVTDRALQMRKAASRQNGPSPNAQQLN
jgi:transcriptional regulator with GAF, ATPase, and Fis domain